MTNPQPKNMGELEDLIADHLNDPEHTRYTIAEIDRHLDIAQDHWNREVRICRMADTLTTVASQYQYPISSLSTTPLEFIRVTHKGIDLIKRSKDYFDTFTSYDWTTMQGTPKDYFIDLVQSGPYIGLRPVPQGNDAGANLLVEYLGRHSPMVNPTDTPFTVNGVQNTLILTFLAGLASEVSSDILSHDPTPETAIKRKTFADEANKTLSQVVSIYQRLEEDEPWHMRGGRLPSNSANTGILY